MTKVPKTIFKWDALALIVICEHLKLNHDWEYAGKQRKYLFGLFYSQRMTKEFPNG